jgi:hypothetical protein
MMNLIISIIITLFVAFFFLRVGEGDGRLLSYPLTGIAIELGDPNCRLTLGIMSSVIHALRTIV